MNHIQREFAIEKIQHICVGEAINEIDHQQTLEIQIIFKNKINRKTRFLDSITQSLCNYQVTQYNLAWNEYIKKSLNFLEYGQFQTIKTRRHQRRPSSSSSVLTTTTTAAAATKVATSKVATETATSSIRISFEQKFSH
ncbi:unnamed protein product [Rotaria sp. Silwood2]|nr:unnamed protein product [Rotaria sp. Silwood2]CAF4646659.1 unnamed protein product [Rotaria sp. Silwood2]